MANTTFVKVLFTADRVGPELEAYIEACDDGAYTLLEAGYSRTQDGDTWQLSGLAAGRWTYENNLNGYFSAKPEKDTWLYGAEQFAAWKALFRAIVSTKGSVRIEYTDSDEGECWIAKSVATVAANRWRKVTLSIERLSIVDGYSLGEIMEAYSYSMREAIGVAWDDEIADAFYTDWNGSSGGKEATEEDFDLWFERVQP